MHDRCFTQAETAILLRLKRCQVRKIEKSVLTKIRRALGIPENRAIIGRPRIK